MIDGNIEAGPNAVLAFKKKGYNFFETSETMQTMLARVRKIVANMEKPEWEKCIVHFQSLHLQRHCKNFARIQENDLVPGGSGVELRRVTEMEG
jgi:L-2-hydroxyglutarate oxidase